MGPPCTGVDSTKPPVHSSSLADEKNASCPEIYFNFIHGYVTVTEIKTHE